MMMDAGEVVAFAGLVYLYLKEKEKKRKWWVHPINSARYRHGHFHTFYKPLREEEPAKFFSFFRMSLGSFDELLSCVRDRLRKVDTNMRTAITPEEMLVITIRYLASGCSFREIHHSYRIGRSTASEVVRKVCQTIWDVLKDKCLSPPTGDAWSDIAAGFQSGTDFPNCLGAIDGKRIRIAKPERIESLGANSKHVNSIGLLAVADSRNRFMYVDVGSFSNDSDSNIFQDSSLLEQIQSRHLQIPQPKKLPGSDTTVPFAFVGDEAFGLYTNLLRPYAGSNLSVEKRVFNYRLSRARRCADCTFAVLTSTWRIFHRPLDVGIDFAVDIVKCCCVLHNFVRDRHGFSFDDSLTIYGLEEYVNSDCLSVNRNINRYREALSNYFVSESGQLPWQLQQI
uniref:DDE Tnp4 domain-containing protein n=1 Tax=Leptobrachium leishanense TaxID=445787 RepID=A0A8C5QCP6_9ANUR